HEPLVMAVEPSIDTVEPSIDTVEPCADRVESLEDLPLELLEDSEGEGLVRHGEILLLPIEDQRSEVATIDDARRKGRERPATMMLAKSGDTPGPPGQP